MPLAPGTQLGPYEISAPLGAGGMGEVYRARDTRLRREVAVKVLPHAFSSDPERLRRFEQEARTASALNHPNILAIYDVGKHDGSPYLISEFLEGKTLREQLKAGPLPVRRATDIAVQVARGIAAAHEKGIIHRDLKPANLFLTSDGRVKILDFGLAKLFQRDDPGVGETLSLTPLPHTESGLVLGTVGYMSPEQVRGESADPRSDIFALGAILYEMLSGKRAFHKESSAETMTAILKEEPPGLSGETRKIPSAVERIVFHCLEKNPAERFESARDLAFDLESLSGISSPSTARPASTLSPWRKWLILPVALLLLAIGLAGGRFLARSTGSSAFPTFQQLTFKRGILYSARFAPDGKTVIYSASWDGQAPGLYSTQQDSPESRPLELNNSILLAVSPSAELAISRGCNYLFLGECSGILARVPLSGGAPRDMLERVNSADWSADGSQLAVTRQTASKFRVEFPAGKMLHETADRWLRSVRISPHGDAVAFSEHLVWQGDSGNIVVLDRDGKQIARSEFYWTLEGLVWSPQGDEVWFLASKNQQFANELHGLRLSGKDRLILRFPGVVRLHDVSRGGHLLLSTEVWGEQVFFRGPGEQKERDLSWLDGSTVTDISSDGENVAISEEGEATHNTFFAYMRKKDGSPAVKLGTWGRPVFSPDAKSVLVISGDGDRLMLLPTGVGEPHELNPSSILRFASAGWRPDGKGILFAGNDGRGWRIYTQDLAGGNPRPITPLLTVHPERYESNLLSLDGKYVVARSAEGNPMLYPVAGESPRPVPGMDPGDVWINWSLDGRSGYIFRWAEVPARVFRLDLSNGRKQLITELLPSDRVGVTAIITVRMTPDGKSYAYTCERGLSELFLVDGVK
jgi:serine/threonine protein kinase